MKLFRASVSTSLITLALATSVAAQTPDRGSGADSIKYSYPANSRLEALKAEAAKEIESRAKLIQEMVDQVF